MVTETRPGNIMPVYLGHEIYHCIFHNLDMKAYFSLKVGHKIYCSIFHDPILNSPS